MSAKELEEEHNDRVSLRVDDNTVPSVLRELKGSLNNILGIKEESQDEILTLA